jgi:hypothetical protein
VLSLWFHIPTLSIHRQQALALTPVAWENAFNPRISSSAQKKCVTSAQETSHPPLKLHFANRRPRVFDADEDKSDVGRDAVLGAAGSYLVPVPAGPNVFFPIKDSIAVCNYSSE